MIPSPFFSIIIPSYNRAAMLPKAVDSVLAQTYASWELIIVDDGSTDNTAEVIRAIDDPRVRYVYQQNAERSAARNNGIDHALGSYICFLDSDDYYLPERLQLLYDELSKRNFPNEVFFTAIAYDDLSGKLKQVGGNHSITGNVFDGIATQTIGNPQVCISAAILKEFKYNPAFTIGEDRELWLRIAQKYPFSYIDNQHTFVAVGHDDRSVNAMRYNSGVQQLALNQHIFSDAHPGKKVSRPIQLFLLAGSYHLIARYHVHQGNRWPAIKAMLAALKTDISSPWTKFRFNILLRLITFSPINKIRELIEPA